MRQYGYAGSFDGQNDYVRVSNFADNYINGSYTVIAFVKPFSISNNPIILYWNYMKMQFQNTGTVVFAQAYDGSYASGYLVSVDNAVQAGNWYFIAGVFNYNQSLELYVNEQYATDTTRTGNLPDLYSNLDISPPGYYFNGSIAQVLIYNRSLNQSEIQYIYNGNIIYDDSLVLWLHGNTIDTSAGIWYDLSQYKNHGTIYGMSKVNISREQLVEVLG